MFKCGGKEAIARAAGGGDGKNYSPLPIAHNLLPIPHSQFRYFSQMGKSSGRSISAKSGR